VHEQAEDIAALQLLLDQSYVRSEHTSDGYFGPSSPLTMSSELGGIFEMHLATASSQGAPFVAPIDGLFFRPDLVWCPGSSRPARIRRDRVSASLTRGSRLVSSCMDKRSRCALTIRVRGYQTYSDGEYVKRYGER
jgi:hypothetical protein